VARPGIAGSAGKPRVGSHPEVVTRKPSVFATANELAELFGIISLRFEVSAVGVRSTVRTAQGLKVPVIPVAKRARPDLVVVPALGYKMPDPLIAALGRSDVIDAGHSLRRWVGHGAMTRQLASAPSWSLKPGYLTIGRRRHPRGLQPRLQLEAKQRERVTS
jgi:hypothetical protein